MKQILLAFTVIALTSCSLLSGLYTPPKPELRVQSIKLAGVDMEGFKIRLDTSIKNPYFVDFPASKLDMNIFLKATKLSYVSSDIPKVSADSTAYVPFEFQIKFIDILRFYTNISSVESFPLRFQGKTEIVMKSSLPGIPDRIPFAFDETRDIPALVPSISLTNFQYRLPTVSETASETVTGLLGDGKGPELKTTFDLTLTNQAGANLFIDKLNYNLKFAGEDFLNLHTADALSQGRLVTMKVQAGLPFLSVSKSILNTLNSKTVKYEFQGKSNLRVGREEVPLNLLKSGFLNITKISEK